MSKHLSKLSGWIREMKFFQYEEPRRFAIAFIYYKLPKN